MVREMEMLVQFHGGSGIERGAEISSGTGGMGTAASMSIDAVFFQCGLKGSVVMLPKHAHVYLGLEAVD